MKRFISLFLTCTLILSLSVTAFAWTSHPVDPDKVEIDIGASDWAEAELVEAYKASLIPNLTGNPKFTDSITRLQFAELVVNMVEKALKQEIQPLPSGRFTDCDDLAIRKAAAAGIVNGMSETTFVPNQTTNREQIATMVARAIAYMEEASGEDMTPAAGSIDKFDDKGQVSSWAKDGVGLLAANGIMNGTSATKLSPKNPCTVEQSILLVLRVYNL